MEDCTLRIFLILIIAYIRNVSTEYNEDAKEEYGVDDNSSLYSESYESFNVSSQENRIASENMSEMDNETLHINEVSLEYSSIKPIEHQQNRIKKEVNRTVSNKPQMNHPYSVSIQKKSSHYASGALVDKQWVLTTAGEFYNVRESIKLFKARLGSINCKRGGVMIAIKWIEIHPAYIYKKPPFDVSLLKLATAVGYNEYVTPIAISKTKGRVVSAKFLTTYWPRLIIKNQILPQSAKERYKQNSMRVSTQNLIPRSKCDKIMNKTNDTLDRSNLCLEPIVSHHSFCMPDPGAPVVAKDGLWGITSGWIPQRCTISSATLFTRLSAPRVQSWLQSLLLNN